MLNDGVDAVLVKVAAPPGLVPSKHLNKTLGALHWSGLLDRLYERFGFHMCGEGGEYETLVLDCPLYRKRLVLTEVEVTESVDGVGMLVVKKCEAVEKEEEDGGGEDCGDDRFRAWRERRENVVKEGVVESINLNHHSSDGGDSGTIQEPTHNSTAAIAIPNRTTVPQIRYLPHIKVLPGGLAHVSEILSQSILHTTTTTSTSATTTDDDNAVSEEEREATLAVLEAKSIFATLQATLSSIAWQPHDSNNAAIIGATAQDVVFVHLYLASISHFAQINTHYRAFFGTVLPPSRSCVAVGANVLPGNRRVMLDCVVQRGSGAYMRRNTTTTASTTTSKDDGLFVRQSRNNPHHTLRSTLHVQTISHWAPVCVGPYSQANTLRSGLTFLAGQIGLVPGTMKLVEGGWVEELKQCWTNAASVLDSLEGGGSLKDVLGGVVYLSSDVVVSSEEDGGVGSSVVVDNGVLVRAERICKERLTENGGITPGHIDGTSPHAGGDEELYGGFEDYDTWKEVMGDDAVLPQNNTNNDDIIVPLLMIALPQMPMGAVAEVELVCVTSRASSCLELVTSEVVCHHQSKDGVVGDSATTPSPSEMVWDLGYNETPTTCDDDDSSRETAGLDDGAVVDKGIEIHSIVRSIGNGCAASTYVLASYPMIECNTRNPLYIHTESVLQDMLVAAITTIERNTGLHKMNILHIRLFYSVTTAGDDAITLRGGLRAAISSLWNNNNNGMYTDGGRRSSSSINDTPACSVVPAKAMFLSPSPYNSNTNGGETNGGGGVSLVLLYAMQIITADLVHLETDMWVHHNRDL